MCIYIIPVQRFECDPCIQINKKKSHKDPLEADGFALNPFSLPLGIWLDTSYFPKVCPRAPGSFLQNDLETYETEICQLLHNSDVPDVPWYLKEQCHLYVTGYLYLRSKVTMLLNVVVTTCAPRQVQPLILNKLNKRAKLKLNSRNRRFIQCAHTAKRDKDTVNHPCPFLES